MGECKLQARTTLIALSADGRTTIATCKDVWALVFLEDGRHLLSGGREEVIRQWRVEDGREVEDRRLTASGHHQVSAMALSGDGKWLVSGGWQAVAVWDRRTRQSVFTAKEHSDWVNEVHMSSNSTKFATAAYDWTAIIWNTSNGRPLIPPLQHRGAVVGVRFSPDGNRLATSVQDGELRIYNAHDGQLLRNIAISLFSTIPTTWSNDSQHIFALSQRNVLKYIYVDKPSFLSEWTVSGKPQPNDMGSIVLSSNGKFIACFVGSFLSFWDVSTRAQLGPVFDHAQTPRLYSIALSPDNSFVATGGYGGVITIHNLNGIIPVSHRDRDAVQLPQSGNGGDLQPQIDALRGILRALELRSGAYPW